MHREIQESKEQINILVDQLHKEEKARVSLEDKVGRYGALKKITEEISENLDADFIAAKLTEIAFSLISGNKGNCLFYFANEQNQKLMLAKSKKEDAGLVIKAKEGDIFDLWVLRHSSPLLIENVSQDFRFDQGKLKDQEVRKISSMIAAPLLSEHRLLGILRLDRAQYSPFSQEDLRFLMTICDLGAIAIENGQLFQKTQELAIHDSLTALYTRGYFQENFSHEVKRCLRSNLSLSVFMIDIDFFKKYNDRLGHAAGDIVLKKISQTMVDCLKDNGFLIGRMGGEEFCVALSGVEKEKAGGIAEELRQRIEKTKIVLRRQETSVTVSIGVAGLFIDALDEQELILKADRALFKAKKEGRNRVVLA